MWRWRLRKEKKDAGVVRVMGIRELGARVFALREHITAEGYVWGTRRDSGTAHKELTDTRNSTIPINPPHESDAALSFIFASTKPRSHFKLPT